MTAAVEATRLRVMITPTHCHLIHQRTISTQTHSIIAHKPAPPAHLDLSTHSWHQGKLAGRAEGRKAARHLLRCARAGQLLYHEGLDI